MNPLLIAVALLFGFLVVIIWFSRSPDAQEDLRIWLEHHWRGLVIAVFIVLLALALLLP